VYGVGVDIVSIFDSLVEVDVVTLGKRDSRFGILYPCADQGPETFLRVVRPDNGREAEVVVVGGRNEESGVRSALPLPTCEEMSKRDGEDVEVFE
jgi:hypothetical protein